MQLFVFNEDAPKFGSGGKEQRCWNFGIGAGFWGLVTLSGGTGGHSRGTGDVTAGVQHQVRDAVLVLIAAVPERDLRGQREQLGDDCL